MSIYEIRKAEFIERGIKQERERMAREIQAVAESLADVVQELYEGPGTVNPVYADALHDIHDRLLSIARGETT